MKGASRRVARLYISRAALRTAALPAHLRTQSARANAEKLGGPVAVVCASEILTGARLPEPVLGPETRYLVLVDVAEPALVHLPRILGLHRPDYRLYPTRDAGTVRRLLIGLLRRQPVLGIVDAYPLGKDLYVLTADFELRCVPVRRVPVLAGFGAAELPRFVVDDDGSYLHWPERDLHLGVSQLLQEVDPAFMADVAIERNERDRIGPALRAMREERSLRQSDIPGIGARQVSRVESGFSRLRYGAARKFAEAFGMQTSAFLDELGQRASAMRTVSGPEGSGKRTGRGARPPSPAA
jgi:hypothetical protein